MPASTILSFTWWQWAISLALGGLFTGLGASIGTYIATQHIIKHVERIKGKNDS
jgi:hypothetical protein